MIDVYVESIQPQLCVLDD